MKKKGRIGSSFDEFLKEDGIYAAVTPRAIRRVIARQRRPLPAVKKMRACAIVRPRAGKSIG